MKYLIGLLVLGLLIVAGCNGAQQEAEVEETVPATPPAKQVEPTAPAQEEPVAPPQVTNEEMMEETEVAKEVVKVSTAGDVSILGSEGFDPLVLKKKVGDTIRWVNNDPKEKKITLTFKEKETRDWITTNDKILPGEAWEYTFDKAGEYEYWAVEYGPKGAVVLVE